MAARSVEAAGLDPSLPVPNPSGWLQEAAHGVMR